MEENEAKPPAGEPPPAEEQAEQPESEQQQPEAPEEQAPSSRERRTRYQVVERDGQPVLVCGNVPNIVLHVERGLTVTEDARKGYPQQTVFLDGVFAGPPFYDNKARQYSLDHHTGCVRAYTLATCEQAVVMVLQGLPLGEGSWGLYINEPDIDALLAAWVLMNHVELLRDDGSILRDAMPLIRVEGVIDAHGPDMEILTALPEEEYDEEKQALEELRQQEKALRAAGEWGTADWLLYSQSVLGALDELLFPEGFLEQLLEIEEQARLQLDGGKVAVLCRSHQGIYAVEAALKSRYDKQLAIVVLDLGDGRFTLRQVDPFLDPDLTPVYEALNTKDLRARQDSETDNGWGGSGDIGGSPRKTGTALTGEQVLEVVGRVYGRREGLLERIFRRKK